MTLTALERLDAVVRIDVRHQGRLETECFVANGALQEKKTYLKLSPYLKFEEFYLVRFDAVVNPEMSNEVERLFETLRTMQTEQPPHRVLHAISYNIFPVPKHIIKL